MLIPIRTVSETNQRESWRARHRRRKDQRWAAWCYTPPAELPCVVTLIRVAPRELDDDNLRGALKAVRDGIADRLQVDDRDPRVEWRYGQRKGEPRQYAVEVEVSPA